MQNDTPEFFLVINYVIRGMRAVSKLRATKTVQAEYPGLEIEPLLRNTNALMSKMYYVVDSFGLGTGNDHIGTCINYADLLPLRRQFIDELVASVLRFVYSIDQQRRILADLAQTRDEDSAHHHLLMRAQDKFRKDQLKGQFSELLIFNLLQHFFRAAPLLRKMRLTTSPTVERHGADAIHISKEDEKYILYIAECKTYNRKTNSFRDAFRDALKDVVVHYEQHLSELNLYIYEDFIPAELESLARDYREGRFTNVEVRLVCMVSYGSDVCNIGTCRAEVLDNIMNSIRLEINELPKTFLSSVPRALLPRMHYILFPIQEMDELLGIFKRRLG